MTAEEIQYEYDMYMEFFDNKIQITKLYEICNQKRSLGGDLKMIGAFINRYRKYAKEKYGIDDLAFYVQSKLLYKKCFDNYKKYIDKEITVGEYFEQIELLNIDRESYPAIVCDYAEFVKGMSKEEVKSLREKGYYMRNILDLILDISDEQEIFSILTDCGQYNSKGVEFGNKRLHLLREYVSDYLITKYRGSIDDSEYESIKANLRDKIMKVIKTYNEMQHEELTAKRIEAKEKYLKEILEQSELLINDFLSSGLLLKQFVAENNITMMDFEKALSSIKAYNVELYQKYMDYINQKRAQRYAIFMKNIDLIIDYILNGIVVNEETNEKRAFDILDYYTLSNLSPKDFIGFATEKCNNEELKIIRTFFAKNKVKNDETKIIRDMEYKIGSMEITSEQKEIIINYLRSINAPVCSRLFMLALRRYLKNELLLDEQNNNQHGK